MQAWPGRFIQWRYSKHSTQVSTKHFALVGSVDGAIRLLVAGDTQVDVASAEQVLAVASAVLAPFALLPAASSEGMASLTIGAVAVDSALNAELELRIALISVGAVSLPIARHAKRGRRRTIARFIGATAFTKARRVARSAGRISVGGISARGISPRRVSTRVPSKAGVGGAARATRPGSCCAGGASGGASCVGLPCARGAAFGRRRVWRQQIEGFPTAARGYAQHANHRQRAQLGGETWTGARLIGAEDSTFFDDFSWFACCSGAQVLSSPRCLAAHGSVRIRSYASFRPGRCRRPRPAPGKRCSARRVTKS